MTLHPRVGGHCGCCGRPCSAPMLLAGFWCDDCWKHVEPLPFDRYVPPWQRTYFARHQEPCPFQPAIEVPA